MLFSVVGVIRSTLIESKKGDVSQLLLGNQCFSSAKHVCERFLPEAALFAKQI